MKILELKDINIYYGQKHIIKNMNLKIEKNEIICIMGSSGCGKSTLLSLINGFLLENGGFYTGEILFKEKTIKKIDLKNLRKKIVTLFQDSIPFPLSIEENILYSFEYYNGKIRNKKTKIEIVSQYLKEVNLYDELKTDFKMSALKLSGGQKQRLCIARILTVNPEILIFDEPSSSLDDKNTLIIENLIKNLSKKYTIIFTTHDIRQANRISDRIINLNIK